ncbi:putative metalloreductase [Xylona heveae TC161]|uniref:Putative metalloreductase n=1 Tax=Xylona heveae (strain CBS 132557 / TC161) TaxID=1328760 RepID=A0A161TE04_XYLHT|nr:putative metalloreductase [Xylona heveae TC161]KZF24127.1 putative metalloreductase [Xylona heveae TC161]
MAAATTTMEAAASDTFLPAVDYMHGLAGVDQPTNVILTHVSWSTLGLVCVVILVLRIVQMANAHLRHLFTLAADGERQQFWAQNSGSFWPRVKRHLLYAPLWKNRHNREWMLSSAINMGTLPSRFHTLLLGVYLLSNVAYCLILDYSELDISAVLADLRGRSGVLAVINMIPLFILAGRNNPLISMLKVSFDTYNLFHRWLGRLVVIESVVHTLAWAANTIHALGWSGIGDCLRGQAFYGWGAVGTLAMIFLALHSPSPIRHAFYEVFVHLHTVLAYLAFAGVYVHLHMAGLPQFPYVVAIICVWVLDRVTRYGCMLWNNFSRKDRTAVTVEALPGEACRVTFDLPRRCDVRPGTHVYVYLPRISLWMSHPFSVAWAEHHLSARPTTDKDDEKGPQLPVTEASLDRPRHLRTSISLVVSKRTGMTAKLYERAAASPLGQIHIAGFIDGPYGGHESLHSYGTVVMFAGGVGITHQVPHVRDLLRGYEEGTVAARKLVLVWSVRHTEHLEWVRPWMDQILSMPGRREVLKVLLFVTKPRSPREVISPSATVQMYPGRANPQVIVDKEIIDRVGAMAVTVCGPGSFADGVRNAVRRRVDVGSIDFFEESFTW